MLLHHAELVCPEWHATYIDKFRIARSRIINGLDVMGAKYLPTKKDLKASARFQQKQHTQSKFIKPATKPAAKHGK